MTETKADPTDAEIDAGVGDAGCNIVNTGINGVILPLLNAKLESVCCDRHGRIFICSAALSGVAYFAQLYASNSGDMTQLLGALHRGVKDGEDSLIAEPEPDAMPETVGGMQ